MSLFSYANTYRHGMNMWPPFLFSGIHVDHIADDFCEITCSLNAGLVNRNPQGSHFGGSLFAMTDPFYSLMISHHLGRDYVVWDRGATIDFLAPGRGRVTAHFKISREELAAIKAAADAGEKVLPRFDVIITDAEGTVVAEVHKVVYVRRRMAEDQRASRSHSDRTPPSNMMRPKSPDSTGHSDTPVTAAASR